MNQELPEIKLPTFIGSQRKQRNSRKTSTSISLTMLKPLTMWITTNCGKFLKSGNTRPPYLSPEKPVCRSRSNSKNLTWNTDWFKIGKRLCQGCVLSPCLFNLYAEYIIQNTGLDEAQAGIKIAGRITSVC